MNNPNELTATDTEETESEPQTCPNCDKVQMDWSGNRGQGFAENGQTYCCEGCADGTGCTCEEEAGKAAIAASQSQPSMKSSR